jgi:hypothetical protein
MSFIDTPTVIPFWMLLIGIIMIVAPIGYLIREWQINRKYCQERSIIIASRKDGIPINELTDIGSGNTVWELGTKKNVNDIKFDTQFSGIRVDPIRTSVGCEPKRFGGGMDVYSYGYENWLPQTHRNHLAHRAISEYFHSKAKDLEFLTDIEFVALVSTPETHLAHDVMIYVSKYFKNIEVKDDATGQVYIKMVRQVQQVDTQESLPAFNDDGTPDCDEEGKQKQVKNPTFNQLIWVEQEVTAQSLVNRIEAIKRDIYSLPIAFGWYSGTEAFKNNAYAYAAQDLEMLLIIHDKLQLADMLKKINLMTYAVAAAIVFIAGALAFYIISMVKK